jgi:uncharacterized protein YjcR
MLDAITTGPNWPQIKTDYEAGTIPVRQIAALAGVSDTAIHKRAKSEGWDADVPALIRKLEELLRHGA